jgi:hypothetical protein
MKYNLVFSGIHENTWDREDTEGVLRDFLAKQLGIDEFLEIANVHRLGKQYKDKPRAIIAKFIYQRDIDYILKSAPKLKGKSYFINRQFPSEIEQARKSLYPVMKELRKEVHRTKLVKDILYVDGRPYDPYASQDKAEKAGTSTIKETPKTTGAKRRRMTSTPDLR